MEYTKSSIPLLCKWQDWRSQNGNVAGLQRNPRLQRSWHRRPQPSSKWLRPRGLINRGRKAKS
ncbi:hypothetical protein MSG28_002508 [Choristoneura fumiferana]|uniref:Uncharacterized protein n=1 Tax=Choristoneura fumiferana TaxID=7141 RepID=A0ACC0JW02_CHOFU|nr:hypothetical protein MSG28_002508 [Choristoneura fumiferana]